MSSCRIVALIATLAVVTDIIDGHGRLVDPAHRGHAWRLGYNTTRNYGDHQNYCGGISVQWQQNGGKCGLCGDNYADKQPRNNENGGLYGTGVIVKTYESGSQIEVVVQLTAAHKGHFEFSVCPLNDTNQLETESCFDDHKLELATGGYEYTAIGNVGFYPIAVILPKGLTCKHCVLRWHYRTGNNWGWCGNGQGRLGCGNQETFRACSDVSIV